MAAGNLPVARSSSKQAMSLVVSDDNPRLQSVLVWLAKEAAKEAAVVAAVAAVSAKSYARAQRHCDEALRLGALASDPFSSPSRAGSRTRPRRRPRSAP